MTHRTIRRTISLSFAFIIIASAIFFRTACAQDEELLSGYKDEIEKILPSNQLDKSCAVFFKNLSLLASKGNIYAAEQMVSLGLFEDMAHLEIENLKIWQDSDLQLGDMTASQAYADILANWAARNLDGDARNEKMVEARTILEKLPTENPMLLYDLGWLFGECVPRDAEKEKSYRAKAVELFQNQPVPEEPVHAAARLLPLADSSKNNGDFSKAYTLYDRMAALFEQAGYLRGQGEAHFLKAQVCQPNINPNGNWEKAMKLYELAEKLFIESGSKRLQADALCAQAQCLINSSNEITVPEAARKLHQKAAQLYRESGHPEKAKDLF